MSTSAAGVTGEVQRIDDRAGLLASSVPRDLPAVFSEGVQLGPAVAPLVPIGAASKAAAPAAFAGAFLGCLTTLQLSAVGVVPEIASALVTTLLGGLLLISRSTTPLTREIVPAVYGGAFGGMTSIHWSGGAGSDHPIMLAGVLFISLSIVCGLAFSTSAVSDLRWGHRFTKGYGGRSGAIATLACALFVQAAVSCGADDRLFHAARADLSDFDLASLANIIAACLAGTAVSLLVLRRKRVAAGDLADKTLVASAIALVGLIVVRRISPNDPLLLDAYYAGCFLGMSSPERLNGFIETMLGAVILASLIIQVGIFLPGIGGGLGLAAFLTVAVLVASRQVARFVWPETGSETLTSQSLAIRSQTGDGMLAPLPERRSNWIDLARRPAAAMAGLAIVAAVIGGLIWPTRFVPNEPVPVATAPMAVVEEVTAALPAAPQTDMASRAVEAAAQPAAAEADPASTASSQTASNEDPPKAGAGSLLDPGLIGAAADQRAGAEDPTTAAPIAPEVAAREADAGAAQDTGEGAAEAMLFREFLQWRAARVPGVAPNVRHPAAEGRHRARPPATPTAAATSAPSRFGNPSPAAQAAPPVVRPRRPVPASATRAMLDQPGPAPSRPFTPARP